MPGTGHLYVATRADWQGAAGGNRCIHSQQTETTQATMEGRSLWGESTKGECARAEQYLDLGNQALSADGDPAWAVKLYTAGRVTEVGESEVGLSTMTQKKHQLQ